MVKGCGPSLAKLILFVVNAIFWLAGVIVLAIGIWALVDSNFNTMWNGLANGVLAAQIPNPRTISILLIVMGAIMFVFGFAGCCGACRESRCLLIIYIILMLVVMLAQVALVITAFIYRNKIPDAVKEALDRGVIYEIDGNVKDSANDRVAFNQFFLKVQYDFGCCGSSNWTDYFANSLYQNQTYSTANNVCAKVPITCCVRKSDSSTGYADLTQNDVTDPTNCCTTGVDVTTGRYTSGCFDKVSGEIQKVILPIGIALLVFALFQLIVMVSAFCLCNAIGAQERGDYS